MNERVAKVLKIVQLAVELGEYDSNVIGMAAEIIAEEDFGMTKASRGAEGADGRWVKENTERTVQVKAWSEERVKDYGISTDFRIYDKNAADDLLVLLVYSSKPQYRVLYNGPVNKVGRREEKWARRRIQFGGKIGLMPNDAAKAIVAELRLSAEGLN
ncbi:hypothetical protein LJ737_15510 [Hymenobacter sp. 15J16-1T3B]|uniref:DUF6998 domain-containing protein n=1 Tax=Hymenobacter sp. 15J16-1T3B TaxID=2886941 RepID=UPI001D11C305|nr:hypothetical protein [Hymenobacter sp. 15J16-1T3B]MCC3158654.1 hypothetical protein [Hymenobacter sp. 15J16-1T3B]